LSSPKVISPKRYRDVYRNEPSVKKDVQGSIAEEKIVAPRMPKRSFWTVIERKHLPFIFFVFGIALAYIANGHYAERQIRRRNALLDSIKEQKTFYHLADAGLGMARKQSRISEDVDSLGLKKLIRPPFKLSKVKP
jgi:hypothetical protein